MDQPSMDVDQEMDENLANASNTPNNSLAMTLTDHERRLGTLETNSGQSDELNNNWPNNNRTVSDIIHFFNNLNENRQVHQYNAQSQVHINHLHINVPNQPDGAPSSRNVMPGSLFQILSSIASSPLSTAVSSPSPGASRSSSIAPGVSPVSSHSPGVSSISTVPSSSALDESPTATSSTSGHAAMSSYAAIPASTATSPATGYAGMSSTASGSILNPSHSSSSVPGLLLSSGPGVSSSSGPGVSSSSGPGVSSSSGPGVSSSSGGVFSSLFGRRILHGRRQSLFQAEQIANRRNDARERQHGLEDMEVEYDYPGIDRKRQRHDNDEMEG